MGFGERSCKRPCRKPENCTMELCNVDCSGYEWDGERKPDSEPKHVREKVSSFKFILGALKDIANRVENSGIIKCPKCSGKLAYTRAKCNGHVHGKCEKADCLSWMM